MLEFIVLGKLPGSSIVITFNWLVIIAAGILLYFDIQHIKKRKSTETTKSKKKATKLKDVELASRHLALYFRRKVSALLAKTAPWA